MARRIQKNLQKAEEKKQGKRLISLGDEYINGCKIQERISETVD
jgi:hypothetical protein